MYIYYCLDSIPAAVKEVAFNATLVIQFIFLKYCFIILSGRQQHHSPLALCTKLSRVNLIRFFISRRPKPERWSL